MQRQLSIRELKRELVGKWASVMEDLAPELRDSIASMPEHVPCPVHGGTDGFRLFEDFHQTGGSCCNTCGAMPNGLVTLAWVRGYSVEDAVQDLCSWLKQEQTAPVMRRPPPPAKKKDRSKARDSIRKAWQESLPLTGSAAEKYLAARGIWQQNMPSTLRFHPRMEYFHRDRTTKKWENFGLIPCLLAPIKDSKGSIVSLHRIFLTDEGHKAAVPEVKKMMMATRDDITGSAIRLFQANGPTLGVCEGIETALAAHAISRMPVWSCVSAPLLESVEIPDEVRTVVIWADLDCSGRGLAAAEKLARRQEEQGKQVEIYLPFLGIPEGQKSIDWLDVLCTQGINGFPAKWRRWRQD